MEIYLQRTYGSSANQPMEQQDTYSFWDYRSCRRKSILLCPQKSQDIVSSVAETCEMPNNLNSTFANTLTFIDSPCPLTLHITTNTYKDSCLLDLYQEVTNHIDPNLRLFRVADRPNIYNKKWINTKRSEAARFDTPAIAVMIFLRGVDQELNDTDNNGGRLEKVQEIFRQHPWRFHHSEKVNQCSFTTLPNNSQDFYHTSHELPLWAVRQVHYGREHIRCVLYVSEASWLDQLNFYKLLLGLEPELLRDDFCLFTLDTQENYDVQFALKRMDSNLRIMSLQNVHIHIRVNDIGQLVPLLPNVCRQISDTKWQTVDHENNTVVLDVPKTALYANSKITHNFCNKSGFSTNTKHPFTEKLLLESYRKVDQYLASHKSIATHPYQSSDISFQLKNCQYLSYSQRLAVTSLSDEEDLDIDLPSPPLRNMTQPDEDETSLTLTNTSEESGIGLQMQHGSEESFCEEEGLRSILSKNIPLKVRHVKFKVRFKEEVETFEDSRSHCFAGSESDEQSDAEMETRFPYIPSSTATPVKCSESSSKPDSYISADKDQIKLSSSTSKTFSGQNCNINSNPDNHRMLYNLTRVQDCQTRPTQTCQFPRKNESVNNNISIFQTAAKIPDNPTLSTLATKKCDRNRNPPKVNEMSQSMPSFPPTSSKPNGSVGEFLFCEGCGHLPPKYHIFASYPCACSINKIFSRNESRVPSHNISETPTVSPSYSNNQQIHFKTSCESTIAKNDKIEQNKNRMSSNGNILKQKPLPSTSQAKDTKTKLNLATPNPSDNKTAQNNCPKKDLFSQMQNFPNGQKKFWFADTSMDLAKNGGSDREDTTLKFTLKFDTCPTSGLPFRQEQIGFYV